MKFPRALIKLTVSLAGVLLISAGCGSSDDQPTVSPTPEPTGTVHVAAYNFVESQVLANVYAGALNGAGIPADVRTLEDRDAVVSALQDNKVDVAVEYLGAFADYLNTQENGKKADPVATSDLAQTTATLDKLAANANLKALTPAPANDKNAFATTTTFAQKQAISNLTQLGTYSADNPITIGGPKECRQEPSCLREIKETYRIKVAKYVDLPAQGSEIHANLVSGKITLGVVPNADGILDEFDLTLLSDNENTQVVQNVVPIMSADSPNQRVVDTLNSVSGQLTTTDLRDLNYSVEWDKQKPSQVAAAWLVVNDLA